MNNTKPAQKTVRTKVPEVEIHLYRQGKGPIVFKSSLGGWGQDQLEVREILEKYGLKSIYAFNIGSGRGVLIRFGRNGRSLLNYRDGSVVLIDGEPQVILVLVCLFFTFRNFSNCYMSSFLLLCCWYSIILHCFVE